MNSECKDVIILSELQKISYCKSLFLLIRKKQSNDMIDTNRDEMNPNQHERATNKTVATKDEDGKSILGKQPSRCLGYYYLKNEEDSDGLVKKVEMKSEKEMDSGTAKKYVVLVDNSNDVVTVV